MALIVLITIIIIIVTISVDYATIYNDLSISSKQKQQLWWGQEKLDRYDK